jgi:hypothetical protein
MIAFEISINGHHIQTVSVGEFGVLTAEVMWDRIQTNSGPILEEFRTMARGLEGNEGDAVHWPHAQLKVGDSVMIRIVDVDGECDAPSERTTRKELREKAGHRPPDSATQL